MDANGYFVMVWTSLRKDGSSYGIYSQRYYAAGTAQGSEFRVNTSVANELNGRTVRSFTVLSNVATSSAQARSYNGNGQVIVRITERNGAQHLVTIRVP